MIAERGDFPADTGKVREFVLKVDRAQDRPERAAGREGPRAAQPGRLGHQGRVQGRRRQRPRRLHRRAQVLQARGRQSRRRRSPTGASSALPGEAGTAYLVGDPLTQAAANSAEWIDRTSFQVEKVKTLEVRYPGRRRLAHRALRRQRRLEAGRRQAGRKARRIKGECRLLLAAAARAGRRRRRRMPPDTGLDKPIAVDATTLEGACLRDQGRQAGRRELLRQLHLLRQPQGGRQGGAREDALPARAADPEVQAGRHAQAARRAAREKHAQKK